MKKVTLGICETGSCMQHVEKEFDFNGQKLGVCARHSFVSFRSPEYMKWKFFWNRMPINFHDHIPIQYEALELTENETSRQSFAANLRIIKFD